MSNHMRREIGGMLFVSPFLVGFFLFFLVPLCQSVQYSFSRLILEEGGMTVHFVGLENFEKALFADPLYVRTIIESIGSMIVQVPIIVLFSLFVALMLNQKFFGRTLARSIFFLPVIIASGVIIDILNSDYLSSAMLSGGVEVDGTLQGFDSYTVLTQMGIPTGAVETLVPIVYDIFNLVWSSGVQILLFLAGLQTVPSSMYECAKIEGATAWESFWKITFPLISPILLMTVIFSIIDNFTTSSNPVIQMINEQVGQMRIEYAAGLSWLYLFMVAVVILIVYVLINRNITYIVE